MIRITRKSLRNEIEERVRNFDAMDYDSEEQMYLAALQDFIDWYEDEMDNARVDYEMRNDMKGYRQLQLDIKEARRLLRGRMGSMDNRRVARELVGLAREIESSNPYDEFIDAKKDIDKQLQKSWQEASRAESMANQIGRVIGGQITRENMRKITEIKTELQQLMLQISTVRRKVEKTILEQFEPEQMKLWK